MFFPSYIKLKERKIVCAKVLLHLKLPLVPQDHCQSGTETYNEQRILLDISLVSCVQYMKQDNALDNSSQEPHLIDHF